MRMVINYWLRVKNSIIFLVLSVVISLLYYNCKQSVLSTEHTITANNEPPLFTSLSPDKTHIDFQNIINEGLNTNVLMYEYFYNGGGVAVGDINNDGLDDIYFTSNMQSNHLYLNKGNMVFEDITIPAGVAGRTGPWKTGVTMADVNGDGLLDIYVCYSGNLPPEKRAHQLFINRGNNTFIDKAVEYGLNSFANSTQAVFFDYDNDGDLDMFLLNHNPKSLPVLDEASTAEILKKDDSYSGSRLFRQDKGKNGAPYFTDVTQQAGLQSSALSYGLGAAMADYNGDGWTDMYISNDYTIPDVLYINDQHGGFINQSVSAIGHTSHFSMGSDAADVNNDGLTDIYTLDMIPEDNRRQKLLMAPDNYEKFDFNLKVGFGYQYMRNMLQLNQGNSYEQKNAGNLQLKAQGSKPFFSEVGQLAGISNTDWSWSALFADFDNDGWKDLYVTNGYLRDYTNLDFLKYMGDYQSAHGKIQRQDVLDIVQKMPSSNMNNYLFKNNGLVGWSVSQLVNSSKTSDHITNPPTHQPTKPFTNVGWGTTQLSNSNGAAYADLDNDGDLDLVVNNINQPAFIYRNDAESKLKNHYLKVKLQGDGMNRFGIGTKVSIYSAGQLQYLEQMPTRGYQSSVSPVLHFGLGDKNIIDSLIITWHTGKQEILKNIAGDKLLVLEEKNAKSVHVFVGTGRDLSLQKHEQILHFFLLKPIIYRRQYFLKFLVYRYAK